MYERTWVCVCHETFAKFAAFSGPFFAFSLFSLECCKICYSSNFCDMFSVSVVKIFLLNHFLAKTVKKRIIIIGEAILATTIYRRVKITKNMIRRIITCCWMRSEDFYVPTSLMITQSSSLPTLQVEFKKSDGGLINMFTRKAKVRLQQVLAGRRFYFGIVFNSVRFWLSIPEKCFLLLIWRWSGRLSNITPRNGIKGKRYEQSRKIYLLMSCTVSEIKNKLTAQATLISFHYNNRKGFGSRDVLTLSSNNLSRLV